MSSKYEIIEIDQCKVTVDISLLSKTEELYFNATEMAKPFSKKPSDWLKTEQASKYKEIISGRENIPFQDLVKTIRGGKHQGTWLHNRLALPFARWCSVEFEYDLDRWIENRIDQERDWQIERLEAKTGFLPMTNAIVKAHDPVKFYHFSTECDMINRIVLGMSSKKYKTENDVDNVRDALNAAQLTEINRLQIIDTGLIEIGMSYEDRKGHLIKCHERELMLENQAA
jgi:KilA-N domain